MPKFTRTAYTGASLRSVLAEIVNDARLKDLSPNGNHGLHPRRHAEDHPRRVRVTITVEPDVADTLPTFRKPGGTRVRAVQVPLALEEPGAVELRKSTPAANEPLSNALGSLLKGTKYDRQKP